MPSLEMQEYLNLHQLLNETTDEYLTEAILDKMDKLWYFYINPSDQEYIKRHVGRRTLREVIDNCV